MDSIYCPISLQIYYDPVIASDGFTYERDLITAWYDKEKASPITREPITNIFYKNMAMKTIVDQYLQNDESLADEQYEPNIFDIQQKSIIEHIKEDNFISILGYDSVSIVDLMENKVFKYLLERCKDDNVLKWLIDNAIDLECSDSNGFKPIHLICGFSRPKIIKYIIDKGVDLECETNYGWTPLHIICRYSTSNMMRYIIDKEVNLECTTIHGLKPIHFISRYATPDLIKYVINKGVDLECSTCLKWKPIHILCRYSTPDIIKYVIEKGVNIDCATSYGFKPIHILCGCSTFEMIKYVTDKGYKDTSVKYYPLLKQNINLSVWDKVKIIMSNYWMLC